MSGSPAQLLAGWAHAYRPIPGPAGKTAAYAHAHGAQPLLTKVAGNAAAREGEGEAGGDYVYLRRAYGRAVGFLYGWMKFAVAKAGSQAALAVGLAIFMNVAVGGALEHWRIDATPFGFHLGVSGLTLVALATIWTVALINCASVTSGGRTALALTIAKVALILCVAVSAFIFARGDLSHLNGSGLAGRV